MCRLGDIILVQRYQGEDGRLLRHHPFIVIDDNGGEIEGLPFDFTCSVMSSFKDEIQRRKKLTYKENMEITVEDGADKDGFIKADQIHYFNKENIEYMVVGTVTPELFNDLIDLIAELFGEEKIRINTRNLQR